MLLLEWQKRPWYLRTSQSTLENEVWVDPYVDFSGLGWVSECAQ